MDKVKSQPRTMNGASQQTHNYWMELRTKAIKKYQAKQRSTHTLKKKASKKQTTDTLTNKLQPVYRRLLADWLPHNRRCIANLEGCKIIATECHHQYKRTGWWLIVMELWLPICRNCHRKTTKDSSDAINSGISISRHTDMKYTFNKHALAVLKVFNISPPE